MASAGTRDSGSTSASLGLIGLGRMGQAMARRISSANLRLVTFDRDVGRAQEARDLGLTVAEDLDALISQLAPPRALWMMVPAGVVPKLAQELASRLEPGDILIDGGNSHFRAAVDRAPRLAERGILHLDVGTSGGVHGLSRGYCLMVGGDRSAFDRVEPTLRVLAPGPDAPLDGPTGEPGATGSEPAPVRDGSQSKGTERQGYLYCGPAGAGHFVKMVHNAIEYGMMSAYAEGFNLLARAGIGQHTRAEDAETAPLFDAEYYRYDFEVDRIAELWRRGSVIPSWLLDLTSEALRDDPQLAGLSEQVSDSGEGRWAVQAAVDLGVPSHVLSASLFDRFSSRGHAGFAGRIQSAMRLGFGGHGKKSEEK